MSKLDLSEARALRIALEQNPDFISALSKFCDEQADNERRISIDRIAADPPLTWQSVQHAASAKTYSTFLADLRTWLEREN